MGKDKKDYTITIMSIVVGIIFIFLWIGFFYWNLDTKLEHRAQIGDSFGSLNALFSALALAGVVVTIVLQSRELRLQRNELSETKKEFQIQNKTLTTQRFENTFFSLLNLHHQIVEGMDFDQTIKLSDPERGFFVTKPKKILGNEVNENLTLKTLKGRDVFRHSYKILHDSMSSRFPISQQDLEIDDKGIHIPKDLNIDDFEAIYMDEYKVWNTDLGHYFRNLYRIVKFVDESILITKNDYEYQEGMSDEEKLSNVKYLDFAEKYLYTSMLRAQLSDFELGWIFYNCISSQGNKKFKPLLEKYGLLKNLNIEQYSTRMTEEYNERAFINPLNHDLPESL